MNTLSEYNKFTILGPPMRSYAFIILFSVLNATAFAQNTNVTSNSLGGCGLTQTNVWSNLSNQAGLAEITPYRSYHRVEHTKANMPILLEKEVLKMKEVFILA